MKLELYLKTLQMDGQYWLSRKVVMSKLNMTAEAFKQAAYRLSKKGSLKRVRGDFFIIIPPEHQAGGSLPALWFIDALMATLSQKYYIGLLSAAALHGAAHQQPMVFQVITDKITRDILLGNIRIQFVYKTNIHSSFYSVKNSISGTVNISTPEMTAYDLVKYMGWAGQINHVATVLIELAEFIDGEKLADLLQTKQVEITVAQRLGYLLDTLDLSVDLLPLKNVLKTKNIRRRKLVTEGGLIIQQYNKKWHIEVNEKLEPDDL